MQKDPAEKPTALVTAEPLPPLEAEVGWSPGSDEDTRSDEDSQSDDDSDLTADDTVELQIPRSPPPGPDVLLRWREVHRRAGFRVRACLRRWQGPPAAPILAWWGVELSG